MFSILKYIFVNCLLYCPVVRKCILKYIIYSLIISCFVQIPYVWKMTIGIIYFLNIIFIILPVFSLFWWTANRHCSIFYKELANQVISSYFLLKMYYFQISELFSLTSAIFINHFVKSLIWMLGEPLVKYTHT